MSNSNLNYYVKNHHMSLLAEYRNKLRKNPKLHSLFIEMTGLCNEHCRHCGSSCGDFKPTGQLSDEEIKAILDTVKEDFDIKDIQLCITGGEPLLRPGFFDIMAYAHKLGFKWGMTSNGILIDEKCAHMLHKTGMGTISISLDGLRETHDWFRQTPGSFDKTVAGIKNLINEGGFSHIQITTVVHKRNINELEDMYHEFKKIGVRSWRVINIEPIGRAEESGDLLLNEDEYREMFAFIEKKRFEDSAFPVTYGCSHFLGTNHERESRKWYFLCNAGIYTASIMYNGDVGACLDIERRPETIQGNVRDRRFSEIWKNEFSIFRTDYKMCGKCAECQDYQYCAGDSSHTWDYDKMEPKICMRDILES